MQFSCYRKSNTSIWTDSRDWCGWIFDSQKYGDHRELFYSFFGDIIRFNGRYCFPIVDFR